jgi:hypothetical protein
MFLHKDRTPEYSSYLCCQQQRLIITAVPVVSKTGTVAKLERLIQISEFLKILKMQ